MTETKGIWLRPNQLFDGYTLSTGQALKIADGLIIEISPTSEIPASAPIHKIDGILTPGFFDIQINGGGGALFNTSPSANGLQKIARAHRKFGTSNWLPTVITDGPGTLVKACDAVLQSHRKFGVAGIHIEGPHIALERKGTHKSRWIRPFDDHTLAQVTRMRKAKIPVLITVAPEAVQPGDIATLVKLGAVVSIGHSNADSAQTEAALAEGAQLFTHLFNAMSQIESRALNVVGTAINSDRYCSIIADEHHVALELIGLAVRARPKADRMIIVTDAMPTVGGPDEFELYGTRVKLDGGKLINQEGSLAGAHVTLLQELSNMVHKIGVPLETALRMVTTNPASLMGIADTIGVLKPDLAANLMVLQPDLGSVSEFDLPVIAANAASG
ncbi:MAG: N-acetylglucosamine-6-phosphate deacetylase [Paracoccaceae bacterium]